MSSAHAQSDIPGHAFRKQLLFTEISNMLRTDDCGLWLREVILNVVHLEFLLVHREFHKSLTKRSLTCVQYTFD